VVSCFPPSTGGLERVTFTLSEELVKRGHQVTVITTSRGKAHKKQTYMEWMVGIKVIRYPETRHFLEAPLVPQIAFRVLQEDYDLLHVHGMTPSISDLAIFCGILKRKPIVVTYHYDPETPLFGSLGFIVARLYGHISYFLLKLVDGIVATTKSYAETSPVLSRLLKRVEIIPLSINKDKFDLHGNENLNSDRAKANANSGVILFVGQLREHKGLRYLLKAMKIVKAQISDARLIVVGDGPQRASLTKYASELKVSDIVSFEGNVTEDILPHYYAISNIVVLPSYTRRDAFGLVLLEAMAAEKPIVASNIQGIREVMRGAGILVPPRDPQKLAKAILEILLGNQSVEQMIWHAQKNIQQYSWEHIVERYERLYTKILFGVRHQESVRRVFDTSKP
jgi:glycosyltransferase involved in cell wall biosynthesis